MVMRATELTHLSVLFGVTAKTPIWGRKLHSRLGIDMIEEKSRYVQEVVRV